MPDRILAVLAALCAAAGIGLMAAAAHVSTGALDYAATILLIHGPAVLVVLTAARTGLLDPSWARVGAVALIFGAVLFAGDISARAFLGTRLFPNAAPIGGFTLISGWIVAAVAAVLARGKGR